LGYGLESITGSPIETHPRNALMGGVWFQFKMSKKWTLHAELTFIKKGTGGLNQDHPSYGEYYLDLSYYEVPILFQYNNKQVYFELGPGLALFKNAGETSIGVVLPYEPGLYPFSKKDFSLNLGAGYVFNEKWRIGLRLSHSLLPVRQQLPGTSQPMYNRGIVLALSRQISFKAARTKQPQGVEE
jgi:hypothetical protein